jgi:hypothetical protein
MNIRKTAAVSANFFELADYGISSLELSSDARWLFEM